MHVVINTYISLTSSWNDDDNDDDDAIGTNHGSLSARVMSFWGDSPRGMVESAIEFAHICRKHDYHNFLFSMKASNPLVMVQAYRWVIINVCVTDIDDDDNDLNRCISLLIVRTVTLINSSTSLTLTISIYHYHTHHYHHHHLIPSHSTLSPFYNIDY